MNSKDKKTQQGFEDSRAYDISAQSQINLHLQYINSDGDNYDISLQTFILLFVSKFAGVLDKWKHQSVRIFLGKEKSQTENGHNFSSLSVRINSNEVFGSLKVDNNEETNQQMLSFPYIFVPSENVYISGLCSVLRFLLKHEFDQKESSFAKTLLGYQGSCLLAPAEVSTWTRFCELEIPEATEETIRTVNDELSNVIELSMTFAKFESHLNQPIRMHNIRKRMQKEQRSNESKDNNEDPIKTYALEQHVFAEGPDMLLSDVILFSNYFILSQSLNLDKTIDSLPKTLKWMQKMKENGAYDCAMAIFASTNPTINKELEISVPLAPDRSLYQSDPTRQNPNARAFTRQHDIERISKWFFEDNEGDKLVLPNVGLINEEDNNSCLDWKNVPELVHPMGGNLPEKRLLKKCQQLEGMANAVMDLVKNYESGRLVVVDFCSGGGHLGIVLAHLLREENATVCLVENKEESLRRAHRRVKLLDLTNVVFYQCNLAYFQRSFDIGISLHACGVATDLVLEKCLSSGADFVCCPCCYGSVRENHFLSYPKSKAFKLLKWKFQDYLVFGHTADQTHEGDSKKPQGLKAMDVIDSDRGQEAMENGYEVILTKLWPHSCTPKNNILIGRNQRKNDKTKDYNGKSY